MSGGGGGSSGGKKPPTFLECSFCGKEFGSKSIGIHEPQCLQKLRRTEIEETAEETRQKGMRRKKKSSKDKEKKDLFFGGGVGTGGGALRGTPKMVQYTVQGEEETNSGTGGGGSMETGKIILPRIQPNSLINYKAFSDHNSSRNQIRRPRTATLPRPKILNLDFIQYDMSLTRLDFSGPAYHKSNQSLISSATSSPSPVDTTQLLVRMDDNQNAALQQQQQGLPFTLPAVSSGSGAQQYQLNKRNADAGSTKFPPKEEDPLQRWNLTCTSNPTYTVDDQRSTTNSILSPLRSAPDPSLLPHPDSETTSASTTTDSSKLVPPHRSSLTTAPTPDPKFQQQLQSGAPVVTPASLQAKTLPAGTGSGCTFAQQTTPHKKEPGAGLAHLRSNSPCPPLLRETTNMANYAYVYGGSNAAEEKRRGAADGGEQACPPGGSCSNSEEIVVLKRPGQTVNSYYMLHDDQGSGQDLEREESDYPVTSDAEEFHSVVNTEDELELDTDGEVDKEEVPINPWYGTPTEGVLLSGRGLDSGDSIVEPGSHSAFSSSSSSSSAASPGTTDSVVMAYSPSRSSVSSEQSNKTVRSAFKRLVENIGHVVVPICSNVDTLVIEGEELPPAEEIGGTEQRQEVELKAKEDTTEFIVSLPEPPEPPVGEELPVEIPELPLEIPELLKQLELLEQVVREGWVVEENVEEQMVEVQKAAEEIPPNAEVEIREEETTAPTEPDLLRPPSIAELPVDMTTPESTPAPVEEELGLDATTPEPTPPPEDITSPVPVVEAPPSPGPTSQTLVEPFTPPVSPKKKSKDKKCRFQDEVTQLLSPVVSASLTNIYCGTNMPSDSSRSQQNMEVHRSPSDSLVSLLNNNTNNASRNGPLPVACAARVVIGTGSDTDDEGDDTVAEYGTCFPAHHVNSSRTLIRKKFYKKRKDKLIRLMNTAAGEQQSSETKVETTGTQSAELCPNDKAVKATKKTEENGQVSPTSSLPEPSPSPVAVAGVDSKKETVRPKSATDHRTATPKPKRKRQPVKSGDFQVVPNSGEGGDTNANASSSPTNSTTASGIKSRPASTSTQTPKKRVSTKKTQLESSTPPLTPCNYFCQITNDPLMVDQLVSTLQRVHNIQTERQLLQPLYRPTLKSQKKSNARPSSTSYSGGEEPSISTPSSSQASSPKSQRKPWTSSHKPSSGLQPLKSLHDPATRPWTSPNQSHKTPPLKSEHSRPSTPTTSTSRPSTPATRPSTPTSRPSTPVSRPSTPITKRFKTKTISVSRKSSAASSVATTTTTTTRKTVQTSVYFDSPHSLKPGIRHETIERLSQPKKIHTDQRHCRCHQENLQEWQFWRTANGTYYSHVKPRYKNPQRDSSCCSSAKTASGVTPLKSTMAASTNTPGRPQSKTSVGSIRSDPKKKSHRLATTSAYKRDKLNENAIIDDILSYETHAPTTVAESFQVLVKRSISSCASSEGRVSSSLQDSLGMTTKGTQTKQKGCIKLKRTPRGILKKDGEEASNANKSVSLCLERERACRSSNTSCGKRSSKCVRILHPPYCRYKDDIEGNSLSEESCCSVNKIKTTVKSPKQIFKRELVESSEGEDITTSEGDVLSSKLSYSNQRFLIPSPKEGFGEIALSCISKDDEDNYYGIDYPPPSRMEQEVDLEGNSTCEEYDHGGFVTEPQEDQELVDEMATVEVDGMMGFTNVTMLIPKDAEQRDKSYIDLNIIVRRRTKEGTLPQVKDLKDTITSKNIYLIMDDGQNNSKGKRGQAAAEEGQGSCEAAGETVRQIDTPRYFRLRGILCGSPEKPSSRQGSDQQVCEGNKEENGGDEENSAPYSVYYGGKLRLCGVSSGGEETHNGDKETVAEEVRKEEEKEVEQVSMEQKEMIGVEQVSMEPKEVIEVEQVSMEKKEVAEVFVEQVNADTEVKPKSTN